MLFCKLLLLLTVACTGFGSTKTSCLLPRALKLLLGLLVAGVTAPMGVASLSEEACTLTAGSGYINSCGVCVASIMDLRLKHSINRSCYCYFSLIILNFVYLCKLLLATLLNHNHRSAYIHHLKVIK